MFVFGLGDIYNSCSVGGAVLLVCGLYLGLWGKTKEEDIERSYGEKQSQKEIKEEVIIV